MTDYIATLLLTLAGCFGVYLIWLMKQPIPPERSELDNDQPPVRVRMRLREDGE